MFGPVGAAAVGTGLASASAYKFRQNQKERELWEKQGLTLPTRDVIPSLYGLYAHPIGDKRHVGTETTIGGLKHWLKEGKKRGKAYFYWSTTPLRRRRPRAK